MRPYFLDVDDVLTASAAALGHVPEIRDVGLLASAVGRPSATAFGLDAYPDLWTQAAALLDSLARDHALVDGNKRTAWAAAWVFLGVNGQELPAGFDVAAAEGLVLGVARGLVELSEIAARLRGFEPGA